MQSNTPAILRIGVFFVPLAPVEDTEVIVSTIAEHLHFAFGGSEPPQAQLRQYLSEKNLLIVVDNFEHLASGADIIGDILSNASNVTIIITSRERLRLRGEHLYEIDHMILPPKGASDEQLAEYPATELFLQSAHRVAPDFEITATNTPYVCKIINLVYGLPLGIELAAGWLEMLSVPEGDCGRNRTEYRFPRNRLARCPRTSSQFTRGL